MLSSIVFVLCSISDSLLIMKRIDIIISYRCYYKYCKLYLYRRRTRNSWAICKNANKRITQMLLIVSSVWINKTQMPFDYRRHYHSHSVICKFAQILYREKNLYSYVKNLNELKKALDKIIIVLYQIVKRVFRNMI